MANLDIKLNPTVGPGRIEPVTQEQAKPLQTPATLRMPEVVRAPLGEAQKVQNGVRAQSSAVAVLAEQADARRVGRRQKNLRTPEVRSLGVWGPKAFGELSNKLNQLTHGLKTQRETQPEDYAAALPGKGAAILPALAQAGKDARIYKADAQVKNLEASTLDRLLVDVWVAGKLTDRAANQTIDRLRGLVRTVGADEVKEGILALDNFLQHLALASPNTLEYPRDQNRARDRLLTFARALHR